MKQTYVAPQNEQSETELTAKILLDSQLQHLKNWKRLLDGKQATPKEIERISAKLKAVQEILSRN